MPASSSREDHFDLLLEQTDSLATWEIPQWPPRSYQAVRQLSDHRRIYLDYEGPLAEDRGHVRRVCRGEFQTLRRTSRNWVLEIRGTLFQGRIELRRDDAGMGAAWTLRAQSADDTG
jgi:hypothetical protein